MLKREKPVMSVPFETATRNCEKYNVSGSLTRHVEKLSRTGKALIIYIHINNPFTRSRIKLAEVFVKF